MTDERRRVSRNQERETARKLGARQHAGSGSGARHNDMHTDELLVECKTVLEGNKQITLKASALKALAYQADIQGQIAVAHIRLDGRNWVLIQEGDFIERFT